MNNDETKTCDAKLTRLLNKRGKIMQNPESDCVLRKIGDDWYYPAKVIDRLDQELWSSWRKFIEKRLVRENNKVK